MNQKTIDPAVLHAIGITLEPDKEAELLAKLQQTLEERIGEAIIELLSPEQAAELEKLVDKGDEAEISTWIAANIPDYAEIVQDEYDILMGEVAQNADKF